MNESGTLSPLWNVPYQRNLFFTGREETLNRLHTSLYAENTVALSHPQGITGLGGIGKTQTALEYAYRYRAEYSAVFWVHANSTQALISSLVNLAQVLNLPEQNEQDQRITVEAVLRWLRLHTGWLLIFDNMDDLAIAEPFLPKAGPGHILFTTRAHSLSGIAQRLEVQKMEPDIGALLLLRRANILIPQATLDTATQTNRNIALEISQELDGLPLALNQAGAYVKETPCSLEDYLARYQIRSQDLLQAKGNFDQDYPASVATTWSLSFEKVRQVDTAAEELLNFCAFLAPDAIPEEIITQGAQHLTPSLEAVAVHPIQFDQAIAALLAYSLVDRNIDSTLNVHRLVQAVLRHNMLAETAKQWKHRAVLTVEMARPDVQDVKQWDACQRWLPHALVCANWIEQEQITREEAPRLLNAVGYYLYERGSYREAEPLMQGAQALCEQVLGPLHSDTGSTLNNLASLYHVLGKHAEAEPLYLRALEIAEEVLGPLHPNTARSLGSLASLYDEQGKYAEAEPLYLRALEITEEVLGPLHPNTAQNLGNLASLHYAQGKYAEAEPLLRRALSIREEVLGPLHPDTANSLNNLALLYEEQGRYVEAEPLYQRALSIREQLLGAEHPNTASSLNNLVTLYYMQGKYAEAEPLCQRALSIQEQQLGPLHSDTALSLNNLAMLYQEQGKYEEAEPLYLRALSIQEQMWGVVHPNTALSLNNLAMLYKEQGKYAEIESLLKQVLSIREQLFGAEHPYTANSLNNLAMLYKEQGKYEEAEPMLRRALSLQEQLLGTLHPKTALSLNNLAMLYKEQGKYEEAEPMLKRALSIQEQLLGPEHPDTAISLTNLALLYQSQEKYAEAELMLMRALAIKERQLGSQDSDA